MEEESKQSEATETENETDNPEDILFTKKDQLLRKKDEMIARLRVQNQILKNQNVKLEQERLQREDFIRTLLSTSCECVICLEDIKFADRYRLSCGHDQFHKKCLKTWMCKRCPLCNV